jgi:hypothetical protein
VSRPVTVAPDLLPVVVEALVSRLEAAGMAFERLAYEAGGYPEALARFDAFRNALDALGWGAQSSIDIDRHGGALQVALAARLRAERYAVADGHESIEKGQRGGEAQVRHAGRQTQIVEAFMRDAGWSIPADGEAQP